MTADRFVMIGCAALLVVSVFANQREGAQEIRPAQAPAVGEWNGPASPPTPDDTWNAKEATDLLLELKREGCIEWDSIDGRMMTCGDTMPALKIVSYERRYVP